MTQQGARSANADAVLHEVLHALRKLQETGENRTIFLSKLPTTHLDCQYISDILGRGNITVNSKGGVQPAAWMETGINGVWLGIYYDSKGGPLLETIEVTLYPNYAAVQAEDVADGIETLQERLKETKA